MEQQRQDAEQRQAQLEQQLRDNQQQQETLRQEMQQQQQMMSWFINQQLMTAPPGSLATPPFAFSWVSG